EPRMTETFGSNPRYRPRLTPLTVSLVFDLPSVLFFFLIDPQPPTSTLFPYTTLFRSDLNRARQREHIVEGLLTAIDHLDDVRRRSEEHTSELQSRSDLVCRLLLEKKKLQYTNSDRRSSSRDHTNAVRERRWI